MKVFYSDQPLKDFNPKVHSIFLAGPTPRSRDVVSWRPDALLILEKIGYKGQVFVPERLVKSEKIDYIDQVEWENFGTENCSKIVFWIPRKLETMPAFTTNVEFGRYVGSGKCMYGRPDDSEKNRYLDWLYKKLNPKGFVYNSLESLLLESSIIPKTPRQIMDEMTDQLIEDSKLSYSDRRFKRFMEVIDIVNQKEPSGPGEWIVFNDGESPERYTEHVYVQKFGSNTFLEGSFRFGEDKNWHPIDWFKSKGWNRWSPKLF